MALLSLCCRVRLHFLSIAHMFIPHRWMKRGHLVAMDTFTYIQKEDTGLCVSNCFLSICIASIHLKMSSIEWTFSREAPNTSNCLFLWRDQPWRWIGSNWNANCLAFQVVIGNLYCWIAMKDTLPLDTMSDPAIAPNILYPINKDK